MTKPNLDQLEYLSGTDGREHVRAKWQVDFYVFDANDREHSQYYRDLFSRNPDLSNPKGIPFIRL